MLLAVTSSLDKTFSEVQGRRKDDKSYFLLMTTLQAVPY